MKKTITEYEFRNDFLSIRPNNFTYIGLTALYDYLIELENDIGEQIEFDVIAICCDFCEYENLEEIQNNYTSTGIDSIEDLQDYTIVIEFEGGIIIQNF